ncbi:MAG: hypothetical protein ABIS35_14335 [Terracoccus sp.]
MSTFEESTGAQLDDEQINGKVAQDTADAADAADTGEHGGSTAEAAAGEDADRGNLDGSNATDSPRDAALDAAQDQASAAGESGQDNGLNE